MTARTLPPAMLAAWRVETNRELRTRGEESEHSNDSG